MCVCLILLTETDTGSAISKSRRDNNYINARSQGCQSSQYC